jgi:hypothetical protein
VASDEDRACVADRTLAQTELTDSRCHLFEGFLAESHSHQRSHWGEEPTDP